MYGREGQMKFVMRRHELMLKMTKVNKAMCTDTVFSLWDAVINAIFGTTENSCYTMAMHWIIALSWYKNGSTSLLQTLYSPNLGPTNYYLSTNMKALMMWHRFESAKEVKNAMMKTYKSEQKTSCTVPNVTAQRSCFQGYDITHK